MASLSDFFDTSPAELRRDPFPHVVVDGFFHAEVFAELRASFPSTLSGVDGLRKARSLYPGDLAYEHHLSRNRLWRELVEVVKTADFISYIREQFAEVWSEERCRVDFRRARPVEFFESRPDKHRLKLPAIQHGRDALWSRLDLYQALPGYSLPVHLDHRRRVVSQLVYFDAADEGGQLRLHRARADLNLLERLGLYRTPSSFSALRNRLPDTRAIRAVPNRMVMFPCTRGSWHSVTPLRKAGVPRQHIQIQLSSSEDVWSRPAGAPVKAFERGRRRDGEIGDDGHFPA